MVSNLNENIINNLGIRIAQLEIQNAILLAEKNEVENHFKKPLNLEGVNPK